MSELSSNWFVETEEEAQANSELQMVKRDLFQDIEKGAAWNEEKAILVVVEAMPFVEAVVAH